MYKKTLLTNIGRLYGLEYIATDCHSFNSIKYSFDSHSVAYTGSITISRYLILKTSLNL